MCALTCAAPQVTPVSRPLSRSVRWPLEGCSAETSSHIGLPRIEPPVSVSRPSWSLPFYQGIDSEGSLGGGPFSEGTKPMWNEDWAVKALCNQARPDELFVRGAAQNRAKQLCAGCPVRTECLAEALDNEIEWGVWGGMTERERRALLRRRPNVTSWRRLLETAMADHVATVSVQTAELVPA